MNKFHERLKILRTEKNMTQAQLGKIMFLSRTAIGDWENTTKEPNIDNLIKLADIFDVSIDELVGRENKFFY